MRGGSARVAIEVAIALAVSWNPLVKSNASAVPTTITSRRSLPIRRSCQCESAGWGRERGRNPDLHQIPTFWRCGGPVRLSAVNANPGETSTDVHKGMILALVGAAQFMVILDVSIVNVALPSIRNDLGFSVSGLQWVVNAYTITFGGLLLLGGRASDLLGQATHVHHRHRRVRAGLARRCRRAERRLPRRRARDPGGRRGDRLAEHARRAHDDVPRGTGAPSGVRSVGRDDRGRRIGGRDPGRHPHRRAELALDLPRQRPDRRRDRMGGATEPRPRPAARARRQRSARTARQLRPARRADRDGRA